MGDHGEGRVLEDAVTVSGGGEAGLGYGVEMGGHGGVGQERDGGGE